MVQKLHVDVHPKPAWRCNEEAVVVRLDVEGADVVHEGRSDCVWVQWVEINDCVCC